MPDDPFAQYAGLDRRVGAYAVDVILLYVVLGGLQFGLSLLTGGWPFDRLTTGPRLETWVLVTISLPTWVYFSWSEAASHQATLGKRLFGLQVTNVDGGRPGLIRTFVRTLIKLIPWELTHLSLLLPTPVWTASNPRAPLGLVLVYLLLGLYLGSMILSPRKRGLHDLAAGTLVLRRKIAGSTRPASGGPPHEI